MGLLNSRYRRGAGIFVVAVTISFQNFDKSHDAAAALPPAINDAIERAREYLIRQQNPEGSWDAMGTPDKRVGATGLVLLALANAGLDGDHPSVQKGLGWLRLQRPNETYHVALQTLAVAMLSPQADAAILTRNAAWLEAAQVQNGPGAGSWTYGPSPGGGMGDNSNTEYALLALHEAARAGARVSHDTWVRSQQYFVACANADGSWGYSGRSQGTGSMTCAGISSIWITSEYLGTPDARAAENGVSCCGGGRSPQVLERGLDWLGRRFSVTQNPGTGSDTWLYYYLYGVERVGRFTARRFIGEHDWFREGAEMLVAAQDPGGPFTGDRKEDAISATSFALMFLCKSRRPVLVAKSVHGPADDRNRHGADDWNRHGHDIAHLVDYVEARWRQEYPAGLSWQVLTTPTASHADLMQAPIFWLSGKSPFDLGPNAGQRLRAYVDEGGFIFAEACCANSDEFDRRLRQLVGEIFPDHNHELRILPDNHPIWFEKNNIQPNLRRTLECVELEGRTCLIYAPPTDRGPNPDGMPSLSCLWEVGDPARRNLPPAVAREVDAALKLGENILEHAVVSSPLIAHGVASALVGLPSSELQISDREAAAAISRARDDFDGVLREQRALVRSEIDKAAASCARAKDLDGLERWEKALKEFDTDLSLPDRAPLSMLTTYNAAKKQISKARVVLEDCYIKTRDSLTESRSTADARAVEDERGRFFSR